MFPTSGWSVWMARRRALKPALFVSSSTWCGSDLRFSGLIWLKFKALALYNISYPNLCLLACELSFTAKSKIWHSFTLCLTVSIHYVFSSHLTSCSPLFSMRRRMMLMECLASLTTAVCNTLFPSLPCVSNNSSRASLRALRNGMIRNCIYSLCSRNSSKS